MGTMAGEPDRQTWKARYRYPPARLLPNLTVRVLVASGGDLGLQDGRRHQVEVVGWLRWKPSHPLTIGPGQAEQTEPHASRSFVQLGAPPGPMGLGPLPGG
jgi:hypothetical protein